MCKATIHYRQLLLLSLLRNKGISNESHFKRLSNKCMVALKGNLMYTNALCTLTGCYKVVTTLSHMSSIAHNVIGYNFNKVVAQL